MYLHNVTKQPLASNTRTNSFDTVQSVYTALYDWSKNYVKEICPLEWSTVTMKPKFEAICRVNHYWPDQKLFQRFSFLLRCHSSRTQNIVFDDSLSQVEGVCNVVKEASRSTLVHVQHNRTIGILGLLLRLYHQFSGGRVENQRLRAASSVLKVLLNALRIWRHFRDQLSVSFSFLRVDDNGCCRFAIIQRRSLSVSGCFLI